MVDFERKIIIYTINDISDIYLFSEDEWIIGTLYEDNPLYKHLIHKIYAIGASIDKACGYVDVIRLDMRSINKRFLSCSIDFALPFDTIIEANAHALYESSNLEESTLSIDFESVLALDLASFNIINIKDNCNIELKNVYAKNAHAITKAEGDTSSLLRKDKNQMCL